MHAGSQHACQGIFGSSFGSLDYILLKLDQSKMWQHTSAQKISLVGRIFFRVNGDSWWFWAFWNWHCLLRRSEGWSKHSGWSCCVFLWSQGRRSKASSSYSMVQFVEKHGVAAPGISYYCSKRVMLSGNTKKLLQQYFAWLDCKREHRG